MNTTIQVVSRRPGVRRALAGLVGCPVGGWAETAQAMRTLIDELPRRSDRAWRVYDLIDRCLCVDASGRYRWR